MNQRQIGIASIVAVVVIVVVAVAWYALRPSRELQNASRVPIVGKAQVGQPAPEFVVATTAGLFDLRKTNKPVFIEVFATWCPHCQRETAVIDRLWQKYRAQVDFVAVSGSETAMDGTSAASQRDVLDWAQRFHAQYPVAYDPLLNVANLYLQGGFPTLAIVDKNKNVAYLNSGEISYDDLDAAIKKAL